MCVMSPPSVLQRGTGLVGRERAGVAAGVGDVAPVSSPRVACTSSRSFDANFALSITSDAASWSVARRADSPRAS